MSRVEDFFLNGGPLSKQLYGYQLRKGQLEMAKAIEKSFHHEHHLVVEAGTGVGKSFAYLAPALLNQAKGSPVVVSTGTIALQEQLYRKDCPALARSLGRSIKTVCAIGRGHYLCENRYKKAMEQMEWIAEDEEDLATLKSISQLIGNGAVIKRSDLKGKLSELAWLEINSESGLCGHSCKQNPCSFTRARNELKTADIIIVNHCLLFVYMSLLQSGVSLLPEFDRLILDEAHHCPDTATEQFGIHLSNTGIKFYLDRLYNPRKEKGFLKRVKPCPKSLIEKVETLRFQSKIFFEELLNWRLLHDQHQGRMKEPPAVHDGLTSEFAELAKLMENWAGSAETDHENREFISHADRAKMYMEELQVFLKQTSRDAAYWVELGKKNSRNQKVTARVSPLDVSEQLSKILFKRCKSVIMTSATLSTHSQNPFDYFKTRMGAGQALECSVPSSFNFHKQAALISTAKAPMPNEERWRTELPRRVWNCLQLTKGGVFVLVTSFKLLQELYDALYPLATKEGYPVYAQGISGSRSMILDSFKTQSSAILIGNSSFWEGVDVPGNSLRNVIITRLPFEVPEHPLQQARYEKINGNGGNAFLEASLPQAVMKFKQGFGRLIRRSTDQGVVCVLDPRLNLKRYGREFIAALPKLNHFIDEIPDEEFLKQVMEK